MTLEMEITDMCSKHQYVCLMGYFNGRTSILNDYLSADSFLTDIFDFDSQTENFFNSVANLENFSISRDRNSKDKKTNNNGHRLLEICKNNNLFIL